MSQKMYRVLAGCVVVAVLGAGPAMSAPPPAVHVLLQIKPGLWEFTDASKVTGDTIFSDAMLAHVPPAQRAQFMADTRKEIASPHRVRECVTQAKFEQQVFLSPAGCTRTVVSNSAAAFDLRTVCRSEGQGVKQDTTQKIAASNPASTTTTTHAVTMRGGKSMTVDANETGRWLSADCGSLKNGVIQQLP